jgi:hypothetical protein
MGAAVRFRRGYPGLDRAALPERDPDRPGRRGPRRADFLRHRSGRQGRRLPGAPGRRRSHLGGGQIPSRGDLQDAGGARRAGTSARAERAFACRDPAADARLSRTISDPARHRASASGGGAAFDASSAGRLGTPGSAFDTARRLRSDLPTRSTGRSFAIDCARSLAAVVDRSAAFPARTGARSGRRGGRRTPIALPLRERVAAASSFHPDVSGRHSAVRDGAARRRPPGGGTGFARTRPAGCLESAAPERRSGDASERGRVAAARASAAGRRSSRGGTGFARAGPASHPRPHIPERRDDGVPRRSRIVVTPDRGP